MRAWEHERSHWRTASGSGTVRHWHFSLWRCRYSIAAPYRQKLPEKDETRIQDQLVNCAAGVLDSTWVMENSGRTLRSSLHFPFAPKPDASAAGWSSSLGRIRHGWGNTLPGWKEGKGIVVVCGVDNCGYMCSACQRLASFHQKILALCDRASYCGQERVEPCRDMALRRVVTRLIEQWEMTDDRQGKTQIPHRGNRLFYADYG